MSAYSGSAVVVVEGVEYPCSVNLRSGHEKVYDPLGPPLQGLGWWKGTIEVEDDNAFWVISTAGTPLLRIGQRGATFLPHGGASRRFQITGNNAPPFD